jgi:hypothetical protein
MLIAETGKGDEDGGVAFCARLDWHAFVQVSNQVSSSSQIALIADKLSC